MKPNALNKLTERAREAATVPDGLDTSAPLGFATRVVALARQKAEEASWGILFERRAWRALGLAGGIAAMSVVFNLESVSDSIERDVLDADDPVTALLDLS